MSEQDKPVAWMMTNALGYVFFRRKRQAEIFRPVPLYTRPAQWVGLTDEEILGIEHTTECEANESWLRNVTRAIEAALKDKNS